MEVWNPFQFHGRPENQATAEWVGWVFVSEASTTEMQITVSHQMQVFKKQYTGKGRSVGKLPMFKFVKNHLLNI